MGDNSYLSKPKIASWDVIRGLVEMLKSEHSRTGQNSFYLAFHGGEPLLTPKNYFVDMMKYFQKELMHHDMRFTLQTNATLVDKEWIEIFRQFDICVSASIDGNEQANQKRVFHSGKSSTTETVNGIKMLSEQYEKFSGVIVVINAETNPEKLIEFLVKDLRVKWFDLLLPDFHHDNLPDNWSAKAYSDFLIRAFDAWFPYSQAVSCRLFDVLVGSVAGYKSYVDSIGLDGASTMIIETDGRLEPHDVLRICLDVQRDTKIYAGKNAIHLFNNSNLYKEISNAEKNFNAKCRSCRIFDYCKGGHMMHRYSKTTRFINPSVYCDTHYDFITHIQSYLQQKTVHGNFRNY